MDTRPWQPSNDTEGMEFVDVWCGSCSWEQWDPETDTGEQCDVLNRALIFDVGHPKYPSEWVCGTDGPCCTKWSDDPDPYAPPGVHRPDPNTIDMFEDQSRRTLPTGPLANQRAS